MIVLSHGTLSKQSGEGKRRQAPPFTTTAERVYEDLDGWPKNSTGGLDETALSQHTLDPSARLRRAIADGRIGIALHGAGN
jgi:hypothetical protein